MSADDALPIEPVLPALDAALARGHAVLTAPTGSGKTTRVPLALLDAPWLAGRTILMLEPRRPAARLAAARMAHLLGEAVGERVGHQVRFERRIGPRTRIQVLTEGILTRRLQSDPELDGCGLVIFDEFHERSLNADLGLALTLDATALRPDLRILVMSATLDARAVATLLGGAPVIHGQGRAHPVSLRHVELPPADAVDAVPGTIRDALRQHAGDLLVFLPGAGEIRRVTDQLADLREIALLPLHGSLPLAAQDKALRPLANGRRRVVLATDIAETSLTIEGISVVIDSGLTRKPRFQPARGLTRLVTEPISQAAAAQRAGRAGRLGPGICLRLWTSEQEQRRPAHRPAEILQADLAPMALELALWGISDPAQLAWLDPPPAAAWEQAVDLLRMLGALDPQGAITATGRRMAALPAHPRLAHMLTETPAQALPLAADLAALISERDPWLARRGEPRPVDLELRLQALAGGRRRATDARAAGFDAHRLAAIRRLSEQFQRLCSLPEGASNVPAPQTRPTGPDGTYGSDPPASPGALLALAYPERIACRRVDSTASTGAATARFLLASGAGAAMPAEDDLGREPWLVIADLEASGGDNRIRAALSLTEPEVRRLAAHRIEHRRVQYWDAERAAVSARDESRLGAIRLESRPAPIADEAAALALLLEAVARDLGGALDWTPAARQLQARVALARRLEPDGGWPDLSDAGLKATLGLWLGPWLVGRYRLADARALALADVLHQHLGWEAARRLEQLAPETFATPAGPRRRIDYGAGEQPVLAVPMQEMFGTGGTPAIFGGRQPLLLHLLSPAGRPLQVTGDLPGFWGGAYAEVRKEMRGRYPKHHWPEDPGGAQPVVGGLKRHARGPESAG
ncbi:ATP-dependent helicase HrpB [Thiohalocapsa marina]|uniref:ATP-dependent helicase HrpB n=1 Tax=Thiohalocapsa marina TaxID=424902 RepID=A0A5M8FVG0_9GAMM|nr:ATP-dependent helicase HrpB [Thiohalocapsa marina]KAA6187699.1 ATP-dependent helicase HrpB [Thiohalocapsa marina]